MTREARASDEVNAAVGAAVMRLLELTALGSDEPLSLEATAEVWVAEGARAVEGTQCVMSVVAPDRPDVFRVIAGAGDWAKDLVGQEWPLSARMLHGRAMFGGKPLETNNAPSESAAPWVFANRIHTGRLVPIAGSEPLPDGRIGMGVIGFWRQGSEPFSPVERQVIDTFGRLVSLAMVRSESRVATARLVDRLRLASQVAEDFSSSLDPEQVVAIIMQRVAAFVRAERITLLSVEGDQVEVVGGFDASGRAATVGAQVALSSRLRAVIDSGRVQVEGRPNLRGMPKEMRRQLEGVKHRLTMPLAVGGQVVAIMTVMRRTDEVFSGLDIDDLTQIGSRAALALQNSRLFAEAKRSQAAETSLLREHMERMRDLEQVKSDFLKLASHELRGPLTVVKGYHSMLAEHALDAEQIDRIMPVVEGKLNQMTRLINEMLETARLEEGTTYLERQTQDLRPLLESAVTSIRPLLSAQHALSLRLPSHPVVVDVDAERVMTIITNLLDNAVKFSPKGGHVRCQVMTTDKVVRVHVTDEGVGIARADLPRLFTRFGRLVTADNSHISGTGLGLYISRELAQLHGGEIMVRSSPHRGTRFILSLPLAAAPRRAATPAPGRNGREKGRQSSVPRRARRPTAR